MFSNRIANSARFLQMPGESQLLYFHMVLRADDDGVVESYPVMKLIGSSPDNMKVLKAKGFIAELNEDQVVVIIDWSEHNTIRADRKVNSVYSNLLKEKMPTLPLLEAKPRSDVEDNSKRTGNGQSTDSISKVRLGKVKKTIAAVAAPAKPFISEETRRKWYDGKDGAFQLLAWFFDKKKLWERFDSRAKVEASVKRHIRAARRIDKAEWSQKECEGALKRCLENPKMKDEWQLETLEKYLTK